MNRPKEIPEECPILDTDLEPRVTYEGSCEELTMLGLYSPDNEEFDINLRGRYDKK